MRPEDPVGQRTDYGFDRLADTEIPNTDRIDFVRDCLQHVPGQAQPLALLQFHDDYAIGREGSEGPQNGRVDGRIRPNAAAPGNRLPGQRCMAYRALSARREVPTTATAAMLDPKPSLPQPVPERRLERVVDGGERNAWNHKEPRRNSTAPFGVLSQPVTRHVRAATT